MFKYLFSFLLITSFLPVSNDSVNAYEYELSICAIFRDDGRFLKEWVQFHIDQGVEHFWLYNNLSQDEWYEELYPYIHAGMVDVIDWPYESLNENDWTKIQCSSYMDCIVKNKYKSHWIAFLDTDEFLFNPEKKDLKKVFRNFKNYQGVAVHWILYGTSNIEKVPDGEMLSHLLLRAPINFECNKTMKSIVQPKYVVDCKNPHHFIYKKGSEVNENKKQIINAHSNNISVNKLRINHYTHRDLDFFYSIKLNRRLKWGWSFENYIKFDEECNVEFDDIIIR